MRTSCWSEVNDNRGQPSRGVVIDGEQAKEWYSLYTDYSQQSLNRVSSMGEESIYMRLVWPPV